MSRRPARSTKPTRPIDGRGRSNAAIRTKILEMVAARTGADVDGLDPQARFLTLGLDSLGSTSLLAELGHALGRKLSSTLVWNHPTPDALARHLAGDRPASTDNSARERGRDFPVAIVGMACRFPGAPNLDAYWELLREGRDAITQVPASRWSIDAYYDQDPDTPGKINTRWGGFLDDVAGFDPSFFGISPREAKQMDPQQRLALELCWEALEDAQIAPGGLRGSRTGVFFGSMWEDYARLCSGAQAIVQHTATGQNSSILPARISYTLGLNGPSLVVNTACSSSLVAVHLACQSLLRGESRLCLVGGVNLILSPESSIAMSKFGGLSPDGRSRAFDARANGYVRGEGGGVVVLKRLSQALEDGDHVYCVIRNSAVNNDGFSNGLTAPNPVAQQAVLEEAYAGARIAPDAVEYVEAHGTGTMLGDPIEAGALGAVLCPGRDSSNPLRIGSAKTNIGHLEAAAGVAGLIKVALSMEHHGIPRSLHFETPNPHIPFAELKLEVQTQLRPWMARKGRLIAGVSSFGFGGTNCHVVLEGRSREPRPQVVFVFGGHGTQWRGMGRDLAATEPAAYDMLLRCDRAMRPYVGWSLLEQLDQADEAQFERTAIVQPAIFAIEVALAEVWRCRGVVPDAVVGQSIGEVAAAYVAGALSLEDAVCVICRSSALIDAHASGGATALIGLARAAVEDRLADVAGRVSIAGVNAPEQTVVSGDADAVDALLERVAEDGVFARRARMGYASHSRQIEGVLPALARDLAGIVAQKSTIAFYSTVTGGRIEGDSLDASYWLRNFRETTLLEPALTKLAGEGRDVFVEVSPHAVLTRAIAACAEAAGVRPVVVASGLHDEGEQQTLRRAHIRLFDARVVPRRPTNKKSVDAGILPALVVLSAKTEEATRAQAQQLGAYLVAHPEVELTDIARSLAIGRDAMPERFAVVASSRESLIRGLERAREGGTPARAHRGRAAGSPAKVAFLLTGQGAQVPGMGRELCARWPVFRAAFDRCLEGFERALSRNLREVMWAEAGSPQAELLHQTQYTQPALFTLEYALYAQWRAWGVQPDFLMGHSIGELVAACVAGVFSLEDAIRLVAARGTLMQGLPAGGAMASIEAPESEVVAEIAAWSGQVAIGAVNTPQQVVISGVREAVSQVSAVFASRGRRTKSLRVSHAFHSQLMEPMLEDFAEVANAITYRTPSIPLVSNIDGKLTANAQCSAAYWLRHVREGVRFADGVRTLREAGAGVFVELGPRATLLGMVSTTLPDAELPLFASIKRRQDENESVLAAIGGLFCAGVGLRWEGVFGHLQNRVNLPTYPWQRTPYWLDEQFLKRSQASEADVIYELAWPERPRPVGEEPRAPSDRWLVIRGTGSACDPIVEALAREAQTTVVVSTASEAQLREALAGSGSWQGIAYLAGLDATIDPAAKAVEVGHATRDVLTPILRLARVLGEQPSPPKLWLVTRGGCTVPGDDMQIHPPQAALWGMGRVFALEHPDAWGGLVDLDPAQAVADACHLGGLLRELFACDAEDQLAFRAGKRRAARLVRAVAKGPQSPASITPDGNYLVTGGLGGIGLQLASWLLDRGARHLVLTGRRGLQTPGAHGAVCGLRARGAQVKVAAVDVADEEAMAAVLGSLDPPLRGVFHAAGLGPHKPLAQTDVGLLEQTLRAKVVGGWGLHQLTKQRSLDVFVAFASGAGVWGGAHQGAYAAANAFLDGLAHCRRACSLPALSIAWGMWSESGMAGDEQLAELAKLGVLGLSSAQALDTMHRLLRGGATQRTVTNMDWERFAPVYGARGRRELLTELVPVQDSQPTSAEAEPRRWRGQTAEEILPELTAAVREVVADVLGFDDPDQVDDDRGFGEQGLDSLMAGKLRVRLQRELGLKLSSTIAFDHPTVRRLTAHVLADVFESGQQQAGVQAERVAPDEPIAIVGVACRFPGAPTPEAYWELLERGESIVHEVPASRWRAEDYYDPSPDVPGKTYVKHGGFLEGIEDFEPTFFRISPREAYTLDPQQRLLLELSWEALERAGQDPSGLRESATGVFVGVGPNEYAERLDGLDSATGQYRATGSPVSFAAGRVSFVLGLQGPSLAVDTACSSSLVALHLACQSLRAGECEQALAGGVNVLVSPRSFVAMAAMKALSKDGRCRTFSAEADGYARAEGCAVVVLKRLSDAQKAGDRVLALIRGTAVNHDGPSSGLTVPNGPAQQSLVRTALHQAGLAPAEVGFVECHGTATPLGDPIEVQALAAVYGEGRPASDPLVLGAAKANLGHLEPAAGIAGLVKLLLMFEHSAIPAQPGLGELNPHVDWEALPVDVPREPSPWPREEGRPRRAAVSGFGLSGTNAHVVVEEPPAMPPRQPVGERSAELLLLSAHSPAALHAQAERLAKHLDHHAGLGLADVAHTLTTRTTMPHRLAVVGSSTSEASEALALAGRGQMPAGATQGRAGLREAKVVFVFPGQGSQWVGMGQALLREEPAFRTAIESCDRVISQLAGFSVVEELERPEATSRLTQIDVIQPVLFAMEVALAALWRAWGVEPVAVVGHSMGEVAAAHVAGALSLEDAATIICRRSRLLRRVSGRGAMALVELTVEEANQALAGREAQLSVAVSNSPRSTVIAGEPEACEALLAELEQQGVFVRRVKVDVASHSPQMDPLRDELLALLQGLKPQPARIALRSTVRGGYVEGEALTPEYWADNLREPVHFGEAIASLASENHLVFVEVSPHPILVPSIQEVLQAQGVEGVAVGSLRRGREELATLLESLGALWCGGLDIDPSKRVPEGGRAVLLPTYPWQRERYWIEANEQAKHPRQYVGGHPLLGRVHVPATQPSMRIWETSADLERLPWIADHCVEGAVVMPGTAYLEMALAAGHGISPEARWRVTDMVFEDALGLAPGVETAMQVVADEQEPGRVRVQISSQVGDAGSPWRTHARATLRRVQEQATATPVAVAELRARLAQTLTAAEVYAALADIGLEYGPAFQGVQTLHRGSHEALATAVLPQQAGSGHAYQLHPALLDACFHVAALIPDVTQNSAAWIPIRVEALEIAGRPPGEVVCHAKVRPSDDDERRVADLKLMHPTGEVFAEVTGLVLQRLVQPVAPRVEDSWLLGLEWEQATPVPAPPGAGRWLVIGDANGLGEALTTALRRAGDEAMLALPNQLADSSGLVRFDDHNPADLQRLLSTAFEGGPPTAVVHLGSLDGGVADLHFSNVEQVLQRGVDSALTTAQAIVTAGLRDTPRLWLVTRGAQAVAGSRVDVCQSPMIGFGRVIALEHAELRCSLLDLAPIHSHAEVAALVAELRGDDAEQEIALRESTRWVARLRHLPADPQQRPEVSQPANGQPYRLEIDDPGVLDRLALRPMSRSEPGPGEVEIEVEAAGLNFLDVLLALGVMPDDAPKPETQAGTIFGAECAGRVVALGEGVEGLCVGQPVIALARGSLASHVLAPASLVAPRPANLSPVEAAAIPITYLTAWYSLHKVARLQPGERVLIHAATGGVGLAAVQWAQHRGAEIYATAGSPEKRAYLESLGVTRVSDSRSDQFVEDVLAWTDGEGVDVVLNSLAGELLERSFSLLRPYGRFVEIGKRDYYANHQLGLRPFLRNLSFSLVDLRGMQLERPELVRSLLLELLTHVAAGDLRPPPVKTFPIDEAVGAFHFMAQARHIGKLVLTPTNTAVVQVPGPTGASIRADGSYLITGGLGGLGLSVATHLASQGAGHLILVGRSGASRPDQQQAVEALRRTQRVTVAAVDVADREALEQVLSASLAEGPPLRGVVHAAGLLDDAMLLQQHPEKLRTVMAPKIEGARNLHLLTEQMPLDFFVMYSAAAGLLGSPGQSNYAAANTFLDALAHYRVARGLPGLSIDWGAFGEVGLAAAEAKRGARLASRGMRNLLPDEGITVLARLLGERRPQVGVVPLNIQQWVEYYPAAATSRTLSDLRRAGPATSVAQRALAAQLAAMPEDARVALIEGTLRTEASQVLRIPEDVLDVHAPLTSLGLDSLMGLELRNRVEATLGMKVPVTLLWTYPTVADLAGHLGAAPESEQTAGPVPDEDDAQLEEEIEDMSEEELALLIESEFEAMQ